MTFTFRKLFFVYFRPLTYQAPIKEQILGDFYLNNFNVVKVMYIKTKQKLSKILSC